MLRKLTQTFEWVVCKKFLLGKKDQKFISLMAIFSILGVSIGVASMMVIFSVIAGFEETFKEQILGVTPHILMHKYPTGIDNLQETKKVIKTLDPSVIDVAPFIFFESIIISKVNQKGIFIKGVDPTAYNIQNNFKKIIIAGTLTSMQNDLSILIGNELAKRLKVKLGDTIKLSRPRSFSTHGNDQSAIVKSFTVGAIFKSGISYTDEKIAVLSIKAAQNYYGSPGKVTGLEISLNNPQLSTQVIQLLSNTFPDYLTRDWKQINRPMFEALKIERAVMALICIIIIIVAAVNIITMLIMIIFEKQRQISILKALGATQASIIKIFMTMGLFISCVGSVLGTAVGLGLLFLIEKYQFIQLPARTYQVNTLPVKYLFETYPLINLAAIIICLLATIFPALQAARLKPVSGIKRIPNAYT